MSPAAEIPAWFRRHFNEDYLVLYSRRTPAEAARETGFVLRALDLAPGARVLDLCCGPGHHLVPLRDAGFRAVGVDLSEELLSIARAERIDLIRADMRSLPFADLSFDAVVSFFTSFGYFERDAEHLAVLGEIQRVLTPTGRFALDLMNRTRVDRLVPASERRHGPFRIAETRRFDPRRERVEKKILLEDVETGATREYFESVQVFSESTIRRLLARAGLRVDRMYGDFDGSSFGEDSPRMLVCGSRG